MWSKQKAVMRGQGYNLVEVLRRSELNNPATGSPWALVKRPVVTVFEEDLHESEGNNEGGPGSDAVNASGQQMHAGQRRRFRGPRRIRQRFETLRSQPCFSWC